MNDFRHVANNFFVKRNKYKKGYISLNTIILWYAHHNATVVTPHCVPSMVTTVTTQVGWGSNCHS